MVDMTLAKKKKLDAIPNFLDVIAPKPADTLKLDAPKTTKKPVDKGKPIISVDKRLLGFEYADGSIDLGAKNISNRPVKVSQEEQIRQELARAELKKQIQNEGNQLTPEQIANIGQLTPEQQAIANSNPELENNFNLKRIGAQALEKGAIGAATGATSGTALGAVVGGVPTAGIGAAPGALIGGGIGAVGGAVSGAVYGTFAAIKETNTDNIAVLDTQVKNAKYNLQQAKTQANKGASYEKIKKIEGDNIAVLRRAERQYFEQSKKLFDTKSLTKMRQLQEYNEKVLPTVQYDILQALQNPNPNDTSNIDMGVDADGNAIEE